MTRAFACIALLVSQLALAQPYPGKPVRLIVGLAPGGATDIMARTLAPGLSEELGQPVVVDNRPGAAGSIGAGIAAKAPPDGYTLFLASSSFTSNAVLQHAPYDPLTDFEPITNVASAPFLLVVRSSLPVNTVAELIAYAKANPGKLNFASSGIGSTAHLSGELLKRAAGIEMTHIVYRGAGPALADVLAGQVDLMFASMVSSLHHAKSGKLKALAVTSARRSRVVPEFPTVDEAGVPGFEITGYFGLLAPAHTPAAVVGAVHSAVQRAIRRPDFVERVAADGAEPDGCTPAELRAILKRDMEKLAGLLKEAGIPGQGRN